jgi:hypothetical protein
MDDDDGEFGEQEQDNDVEMAGAGEKKPPATAQAPKKQDPLGVNGITATMQRVNMNPPPCFSTKTKVPYLLSPTSYFLDRMK